MSISSIERVCLALIVELQHSLDGHCQRILADGFSWIVTRKRGRGNMLGEPKPSLLFFQRDAKVAKLMRDLGLDFGRFCLAADLGDLGLHFFQGRR